VPAHFAREGLAYPWSPSRLVLSGRGPDQSHRRWGND